VARAEVARNILVLRERKDTARRCDTVFTDNDSAIVQRCAGEKESGQQFCGDLTVKPYAGILNDFGSHFALNGNQRPDFTRREEQRRIGNGVGNGAARLACQKISLPPQPCQCTADFRLKNHNQCQCQIEHHFLQQPVQDLQIGESGNDDQGGKQNAKSRQNRRAACTAEKPQNTIENHSENQDLDYADPIGVFHSAEPFHSRVP